MKAKSIILDINAIRAGLLAIFVLFLLSFANLALGQATSGPVRITLDEAVQMALQHNHNMIAARTAIEQSLALR